MIRQDPEAERVVRAGREIGVHVSIGLEMVNVPDLTNLSERESRLRLAQFGLEIGEIDHAYHPNMPPDLVIAQQPEPDTRVRVAQQRKPRIQYWGAAGRNFCGSELLWYVH